MTSAHSHLPSPLASPLHRLPDSVRFYPLTTVIWKSMSICVNLCPSTNGHFIQSLSYAQILILEISLYIPAVKIFAYLDLEQNISFPDEH